MKKLLSLSVLSIFIFSCTTAQEFSDYGKVYPNEIELKKCSFDEEANAVILMHEAFSNYDDQHHLITYHHVRIKILKEQGISAANISIDFYRADDFEQIYALEGMTINIGANNEIQQTKIDRKSVFTKKINERRGQVVCAFPAIKVGSIIDYKYTSQMKHYGGLDEWSFQDELPVLTSKYTLFILPNAEFAYRVNKTLDIPIISKKLAEGIYFEMTNIPGLGNEPYIDARADYLQKVIFQLSGIGSNADKQKYATSWNELARELNISPEFGGQLGKNIDETDDLVKAVKLLSSPEEKMKTVYNFVRENMRWNNLYSKYAIDGVKGAWKKKTGTSGDINLMLVNLLKEVELEAYPMLVSERFHGKVKTDYPFMDQFNSVFACVEIGKRKYYLDATDKLTPPHLAPSGILNTTAFLVKRKAGELINITDDSSEYKEQIIADLVLSEDGSLSGNVLIKSYDYARILKLDDYKRDKEKFTKEHFELAGTSIGLTNVELTNMQNDSLSLDQTGKLSGSLNRTGEYSFLPLNLFTGFDANPFIAINRFSNINLGYKRTIIVNINVQLPAAFVIEELPKSVRLTNPEKDIVFLRQLDYNKPDNRITCQLLFQFKKSLYEADLYGMVREMYKKLFDYLKEPVVLTRSK